MTYYYCNTFFNIFLHFSGGIPLTVMGTYLDSVAFPYLQVTMVYTPNSGPVEESMFDSVSTLNHLNVLG